MYRLIVRGIHELNEKAARHEKFVREALEDVYLYSFPDIDTIDTD